MSRRMAGLARCVLGVALLIAVPGGALGHTRSQSFSSWVVADDSVRMTFSVEAREVTRLPPLEGGIPELGTLLKAHLRPRIQVLVDGEPCPPRREPRVLSAREGYVRVEWDFERPQGASLEIVNDAFFDVAPSHLHYARVRIGSAVPEERLFTDATRRVAVGGDGASGAVSDRPTFRSFMTLGVEHIFSGLDHVAFLLTLLLLCRRARDVLFMVTGFTLGHSVTLGLAVLGVVQPNVPVIEALIGFTIALVAAENIAVRTGVGTRVGLMGGAVLSVVGLLSPLLGTGLPMLTWLGLGLFTASYLHLSSTREHALRLRPLLTVLFGLIHGFGFANVLLEIGLPTGRLVESLLGFNVGVELGQLAIVAALWLCGAIVARVLPRGGRPLVRDLASTGLCALGVFWFVGRAIG